ncbi:MAG TPA: S41 family peptidase [Chloroflexota bacterium]
MKLQRAVVPVVLLSLAACAGPRLPWQGENPGLDPIHAAYQTLLANYVDQPKAVDLLTAAYQGTRQTLADAGVHDDSLQPPAWTSGDDANWQRFVSAYIQIANKYAKQVGSDKLEYGAIGRMASSLNDCQTRFYDPSAMKERQGEVSGQQDFGGIGVLMKNIPGHPTVLRVLNGPAQSSGLKPGDEIVAVDGKPTAGQSFEQVRNGIRGPQGTSVKVTVKRPGSAGTQDFDIARAQIQAPIIEAAIIGGAVGYIHLYSFPQAIPEEIDRALQVFDQNNVDSVVFDVRANTGGDQQTILQVLSRFIKGGTAEVQVDRAGKKQEFSLDPSLYWQHPRAMVVLADEDTQSGGEMFAKALQEEGGYQVVGAPTAGCAASGHLYQLSDGSGLEVSIGKIVSAKGQDINRVGVKPDQPVQYPVDDLAAGRDPQLGAAIDALHTSGVGRAVTANPSSGAPAAPPPSASSAPESPVLKPLGPTSGGASIQILK